MGEFCDARQFTSFALAPPVNGGRQPLREVRGGQGQVHGRSISNETVGWRRSHSVVSGRQLRFPDLLAKSVQFAQLSNEIGSRVGDGCNASLKRTHLRPPLKWKLQLQEKNIVDERGAAAIAI